MKIKVQRRFFGSEYTIGSMFINHTYFCDVLEDTVRELPHQCPNTPKGLNCTCPEKVFGQTAIPAGIYKVILSYSPKFKRKLPRLLDVPHFIGILAHRGLVAENSLGCLLVGENKVKGKVINSAFYEQKLVALMEDAITRGEEIEIEIV